MVVNPTVLSAQAVARARQLIRDALRDAVGKDYLGVPHGKDAFAKIGFAYARVSTAEQTEEGKTGLPRELLRLDGLATRRGLHVPFDNIIGEDFTGQSETRPWMDQLILALEQAPCDQRTVLIEHVDRLGRKVAVQFIVQREIERRGGSICYVQDLNEDQQLLFGVLAEIEARRIGERRRYRNRIKNQNHELASFKPRYGYRMERDGAKRVSVPDPERVEVVNFIMKTFAETDSIGKVRAALYAKNIRAPRGGKVWSTATIYGILTDETYIGIHYQNRYVQETLEGYTSSARPRERQRERPREEWVAIAVPAIVDVDLFMGNQARLHAKDQTKAGRPEAQTLMRGRLRCGCARSMVKGRGNGQPFYYCPRHVRSEVARHGQPFCPQRNVKVKQLDELVWSHIARRVLDPGLFHAFLLEQQAASAAAHSRTELQRELVAAERAYENAKQQLQRFFERGGKHMTAALAETVETLGRRHAEAQRALAAVVSPTPVPSIKELTALLSGFDPNATDLETRRSVFRALVETVTLSTDGTTLEIVGLVPGKVQVQEPAVHAKSFSSSAGTASAPGDGAPRPLRAGDRSREGRRPA